MKELGRLIIGSGEASSDMRYAAGVSTPDDIIWVEGSGRRILLVSALEIDRVKSSCPADTQVLLSTGNEIDRLVTLAGELNVSGFYVPGNFPLLTAELLREKNLTVKPVSQDFFPEREFKNFSELQWIKKSLRAAEAGCRRGIEVLRQSSIDPDNNSLIWQDQSLTSEILRYEVDVTLMKYGMQATGTICAGASQSAQPHNTGSGLLYAHTPIVMDIFPRSLETGYWGDLTRTVVKGRAPDIVKKAFDAVLMAKECAKSHLRAGVSAALLHEEAWKLLTEAGFPTGQNEKGNFGFFHGLGHGVGLDIHEAPRLSPRNVDLLKGGEVVTIEPGVYYPEWGGIRLEDMAYVPENGPAKILTEIDTFLEL